MEREKKKQRELEGGERKKEIEGWKERKRAREG